MSMELIIASLWKTFGRVPPASIPAMLDCILTSQDASPVSFFNDLLNVFPKVIQVIAQKNEEMESQWHDYVLSYVTAVSYFLKKSGVPCMEMYVWKMLIPLLNLVHSCDRMLFYEVTTMFLDTVNETSSWEVIEATMVPPLLRSIGLSMGTFQIEELATYKITEKSRSNGLIDNGSCGQFHDKLTEKCPCEDMFMYNSYDFPLTLCCNILTLILDYALQNKYGSVPGPTPDNARDFLVGNMLWDLSNLTFQMISHSLEHRSFAIKSLLPFIFKVFARYASCTFTVGVPGMHHALTRNEFYVRIWKSCKLLFSLGSLERRDAYDILSLFLSSRAPLDEHESTYEAGLDEGFDLRAYPEFWDEIKRGLLDKESIVRKQSLHILKTTLHLKREKKDHFGILKEVSEQRSSDAHSKSKRGKWADEEAKSLGVGKICNNTELSSTSGYKWEVFFLLYEMLEEYGTHLVEAAWNHQITLWLRASLPLEDSEQCHGEDLYLNRVATVEQIFGWLAVLWERGFFHDNPQVRCLIMQSFFAIEWENYGECAKLVSNGFVLGPLMRGLNDPVHHSEFGVKEMYTSRTIEAAARFLHQYVSSMDRMNHISFLINLSMVPKQHSLGRAGLMCLAECIAAAARGIPKYHSVRPFTNATNNKVTVESFPNHCLNDRADLLDVLRFVLECSKRHFNPKYRYQVCEKVLAAATMVMTAADVPLEILLHYISCLPCEYTDYGGSLGYAVRKWLCSSRLELLKAINEFPLNFICPRQFSSSFAYDDDELNTWRSEVKRWARVLFLLADTEEFFEPLLKFIKHYGGNIFKQKRCMEWVAVKFLILFTCLVDELQVIQEGTVKCHVAERMKGDLGIPKITEDQSLVEKSMILNKFASIFHSILEELVSFTKLSSNIFWSAVVSVDMPLPGAVRGKLGGPSQRRLPSSICTTVLEAVTSIKALASVFRWCAQFREDEDDDLTNSVQAFLWNFCWKIITTAAPKSEVEGEILVAAYEACAHALKDLQLVFSLSPGLVTSNSNSFLPKGDDKVPLNVFVSAFLDNVNNLIDGANLARTRRAVLMNLKWSCLESLLLLQYHALSNEINLRGCKIYFSDTILTQIFGDLVGSLENAGEVSVLPILRSVRLVMELFEKRRDPTVSSSCEITIEMMWLLVHSSWIMHVSCNKRRVAPTAALLSCVLHHSIFGDEYMHEFNSSPGPLKWFIEKILEEGTKSPRTIRLAALHLSGLFLVYPNTIKYYMKELKLLTLYGSVAFDEDFEAEVAENYDARFEVSMLSKSPDPELTDVFINTELYARVSVAVLFSRLADMAYLSKSTIRNEDKDNAIASGKMFLLELLNYVVIDRDLSKELYKKYSAIHRRKVRAWQMICVLSRFVDQDIVEQVMSCLHTSLHRNNLPSVRYYLEAFGIYIYLKFPSLIGQQLVPMLRKYDLRPQALSSYVFIAANILLHGEKDNQFGHLDELLPPVVPMLTSHHHTLRGVTQILVYQVLQKLLPDSNSSLCASMSLERNCFYDLRYYLAHNPDCAKLRASMDRHLYSFDPVESLSPAGIFTKRDEDLDFECVPTTLMDRINDFLNDAREDLRSSMAKDAATVKNESIGVEVVPKGNKTLNSNGEKSIQLHDELFYDFQRKITFTQDKLQDTMSTDFFNQKKLSESLSDIANEDQLIDQLLHSRGVIVEELKASRQQIILVASLIDRIPNLAGLARTCEVFRAGGLTIANKNVLNDKQFQLISVTAEKWVPIMEVPVESMKVYLEKKKQENYAILGLEQTANSIPMEQYSFPTKTVLVLGHEKEGIPVEIIHMMDACIEIPQLGVVRSLNVHVSGALALWEYTRQHNVR